MRALAKQLKTKQLSPNEVVFDFGEEKWIFGSPTVVEANMMGNIVFQVMGKHEVITEGHEDIALVMEKTGCSKEVAKRALKEHGDVAEAILHISGVD
ncbi:nascent polypeptide-associated complex protein [Candidatus Bathyarchaeota archaeon]|nr:nascent polypeptide-associated complex protein [Candidatus Bathyarchaeota archaeon]